MTGVVADLVGKRRSKRQISVSEGRRRMSAEKFVAEEREEGGRKKTVKETIVSKDREHNTKIVLFQHVQNGT